MAPGPLREADVVAFLRDPQSYAPAPATVEMVETHAARIFLAGAHAYKIKRPVRYSYLDFSSLERRRQTLLRELALNRPHAPEIYETVLPIRRTPAGELTFGEEGEIVEWALRMHRFDEDQLLSRVAATGPLPKDLVSDLARTIAHYHEIARPSGIVPGSALMAGLISELDHELGKLVDLSPPQRARALVTACRLQLDRSREVLDERARLGCVRRCHGDLHLGNIVLLSGRPVLFDALEFSDELATTDTLYDLAFLLMDLDQRDQRAAANLLLNRYLVEHNSDADLDGLVALPLFLALRAAIRGMTTLQRAKLGAASQDQVGLGRRYLEAAVGYANPAAPRLVAIAGFSGTGKSTVAASLAPHLGAAPGAVHVRSDIERKRLLGRAELERLGSGGYTAEVGRQVYARLRELARRALTAGQAVVVDAVFADESERTAVEQIAAELAIPFTGLWLDAPAEVLRARVTARRGDASDADAQVVDAQLRRGRGSVPWREIDASGTAADTTSAAEAALLTARRPP